MGVSHGACWWVQVVTIVIRCHGLRLLMCNFVAMVAPGVLGWHSMAFLVW